MNFYTIELALFSSSVASNGHSCMYSSLSPKKPAQATCTPLNGKQF